jgi:peptidoglycan L-alanyl-D-glutamate endopeptidase CwlK
MSFQLSARSIIRLDGVHPALVAVVRAAIAISKVDFTVLEGRRTLEKQREYFNAGKSRTMASKHLSGHAVDLAPILDTDGDGDTELSWRADDFLPINDAMQQAAANLNVKLTWGGLWKSFPDCPHWEISPKEYP